MAQRKTTTAVKATRKKASQQPPELDKSVLGVLMLGLFAVSGSFLMILVPHVGQEIWSVIYGIDSPKITFSDFDFAVGFFLTVIMALSFLGIFYLELKHTSLSDLISGGSWPAIITAGVLFCCFCWHVLLLQGISDRFIYQTMIQLIFGAIGIYFLGGTLGLQKSGQIISTLLYITAWPFFGAMMVQGDLSVLELQNQWMLVALAPLYILSLLKAGKTNTLISVPLILSVLIGGFSLYFNFSSAAAVIFIGIILALTLGQNRKAPILSCLGVTLVGFGFWAPFILTHDMSISLNTEFLSILNWQSADPDAPYVGYALFVLACIGATIGLLGLVGAQGFITVVVLGGAIILLVLTGINNAMLAVPFILSAVILAGYGTDFCCRIGLLLPSLIVLGVFIDLSLNALIIEPAEISLFATSNLPDSNVNDDKFINSSLWVTVIFTLQAILMLLYLALKRTPERIKKDG